MENNITINSPVVFKKPAYFYQFNDEAPIFMGVPGEDYGSLIIQVSNTSSSQAIFKSGENIFKIFVRDSESLPKEPQPEPEIPTVEAEEVCK